METNDLKTTLALLKGHYFNIQGQKQRVMSVNTGENVVVISTDVSSYTPPVNKVREYILDKFFPVDNESRAVIRKFEKGGNGLQVITKEVTASNDKFTQLQEILMANIKKVQEDRNYIPQAAEINNNVKSMIDLTKTQVEMLKLMKQ